MKMNWINPITFELECIWVKSERKHRHFRPQRQKSEMKHQCFRPLRQMTNFLTYKLKGLQSEKIAHNINNMSFSKKRNINSVLTQC